MYMYVQYVHIYIYSILHVTCLSYHLLNHFSCTVNDRTLFGIVDIGFIESRCLYGWHIQKKNDDKPFNLGVNLFSDPYHIVYIVNII